MIKNAFPLFVFIISLLFIQLTQASDKLIGFPLITNYVTDVYVAHPQNWGIAQDNNGIMYFANGDGVLVYDGKTWEIVELPNNSPARALGKDISGIIYTAGTNFFGYLQPNDQGKLVFVALLISDKETNLGTFREILTIDSCVFFKSEQYVFRYNLKSISSWKAKSNFTSFFLYNNKLFIHDEKMGLLQLDGDSLVAAPSGGDLKNMRFYFARQLKDEVILATRTDGLFVYNPLSKKNSRINRINSKANQILIDNFVYSGTITKNGEIVLGTNSGGCVIINKEGDILSRITTQTGILQDKIHFVFIDKDDNLWFALDKGISRCDYSGPITFWDERHGLNGIVQNFTKYKDKTFIGTLQGLYYLEDGVVKQIKKGISQTWSFFSYKIPNSTKTVLLIGAIEGIFIYENGVYTKIPNSVISYKFHVSKHDPSIIYFGSEYYLGILKYRNGAFAYLGQIPNSGVNIRSIDEDDNGDLWLSTFRDGVYRITPSDNILAPKKILHYDIEDGLPSLKNILIYRFNERLIFATQNGFYHFDEQHTQFKLDLTLGDIFYEKNKDIFNFINDDQGNVYITQLMNLDGSIGYATKNPDGSFSWNSRIFNKIPRMMMLVTFLDDKKNLWIGGSEGLFKFDQSKVVKRDTNFNTTIRKVLVKGDSGVFYGNYYIEKNGKRFFSPIQNDHLKLKVPFKKNSLIFNYSAPEFSNEFELKYKYKLEGYDEYWSDWTSSTIKEYTNLHEGEYMFRVVAKNLFNTIGNESSFEFTIMPPWYRTTWSFFGYIVLTMAIVTLIVRISLKQLRNTNLYLEEQVKIRTSELNQQKEELLTQSEELLAVTEELERKNFELEKLSIVASKTDNAIVIMDGNGNFEWVNEGFTEMYGLTLNQFIKKRGKNIFECANTEEILNQLNKCISEKESVSYEFHYIYDDGSHVWAQTTITPITNENYDIVKLIAIDSNITNLKLAEQEIIKHKNEIEAQRDYTKRQRDLIELQNMELEKHRLNLEELVKERTIELEKAKEKAEESDRLKSTFLANMSHEIRTPMNAIVGFSNFLKTPDLTPEEKEEFVQQITMNSNTLLHLIDDILDISKIEAGQLTIINKPFDLNNLFKNLHEVFLEKKNNQYNNDIELRITLEKIELELIINSDPLRVQQILSNLVDNAIKFTESGFVEYGYTLEVNHLPNRINFFVRDTGIGLSKDQQVNIFNRFTKVENYQKLYRGAGLGLAICKNLVNLLGGEMRVESELGKGSVFTFSLPIFKQDELVLIKNLRNGNEL